MATSKTYWEKLKDPRWQKKRLEVLERASFRCSHCNTHDKPLHVHHGYYGSLDPWDYPDRVLHVLCEDCHAAAEAVRRELYELIGFLSPLMLDEVVGFVQAHADSGVDVDSPIRLRSSEHAAGLGAYHGLTDDEVIASADDDQCITLARLYLLGRDKKNKGGR